MIENITKPSVYVVASQAELEAINPGATEGAFALYVTPSSPNVAAIFSWSSEWSGGANPADGIVKPTGAAVGAWVFGGWNMEIGS